MKFILGVKAISIPTLISRGIVFAVEHLLLCSISERSQRDDFLISLPGGGCWPINAIVYILRIAYL